MMYMYRNCGCYDGPWWGVTPPPQCDFHAGRSSSRDWLGPTTETATKLTFAPPAPQPMSAEDVERIAQRVAELLKPKRRRKAKP